MKPFQQLRVWMRRASVAERTTAVATAVVALGLVGWLVTPVHHGGSAVGLQTSGSASGVTAGGAQAQSANAGSRGGGSTSSGGAIGATAGGSGSAGSVTGTGPTGSNGKANPSTGGSNGATGGGASTPLGSNIGTSSSQCPPTVDQGTTASRIDVAITILNIAGSMGDSTVGLPSPAQQQQDWQIVGNAINASGGAACRNLALHFYQVDPVDSNNAQQQCLAIAASHPFVALDIGALIAVGASDCIPEQQIPLVGLGLSTDQMTKYYPYYISPGDTANNAIHDGVLAWKQDGYLSASKGFTKLGLLYHNCLPAYVATMEQTLQQVGVPASAIVAYDLGCPPDGQDNPADLEQAVLMFKTHGVTDVTETDNIQLEQFSQIAQQQNWNPDHYILADPNSLAGGTTQYSSNFNGAIDMVQGRGGEATTPGYQPTGGTAACNAMFAAQKQPPVYQQPDGYGGIACALLSFVQALIDHAPQLKRSAQVSGMHSIGFLDFSYPGGPVNFSGVPSGSPFGRGYWRLDQWHTPCSCWQVPNPAFNPPFN